MEKMKKLKKKKNEKVARGCIVDPRSLVLDTSSYLYKFKMVCPSICQCVMHFQWFLEMQEIRDFVNKNDVGRSRDESSYL